MAKNTVAEGRQADKPTFIYGLIDPRTQEIRYVGKSVLSPARRLAVHLWRAKTAPHKRHSMAWLLSLHREGVAAIVETLEEVPPNGDWVEAEQFWISSLRLAGARLCNHTAGGEGQTGYKQPPEMVAKRIKRGAEHHRTGKRMPEHVREALRVARKRQISDPEWCRRNVERRRAAITPEQIATMRKGLAAFMADPIKRQQRKERHLAAAQSEQARQRVADWSRRKWSEKREEMIASLIAGKGRPEVRAKLSAATKAAWANPNSRNHGAWRDRKLSNDDVAAIRLALTAGERVGDVAAHYGVSQSLISLIKANRRRRV